MASFSASLINLTALLPSSRDISYHAPCDVSVIRARKDLQDNFIFIYDKLGLHVSAYQYVATYYTTFKVFIYFD
jgi:hypothetical protein